MHHIGERFSDDGCVIALHNLVHKACSSYYFFLEIDSLVSSLSLFYPAGHAYRKILILFFLLRYCTYHNVTSGYILVSGPTYINRRDSETFKKDNFQRDKIVKHPQKRMNKLMES